MDVRTYFVCELKYVSIMSILQRCENVTAESIYLFVALLLLLLLLLLLFIYLFCAPGSSVGIGD